MAITSLAVLARMSASQRHPGAQVSVWPTHWLLQYLGSLDLILKPVKLLGFVACDNNFTQQATVINAASKLLLDIFGEQGQHARSAIGSNSLPLGLTVEIESIFELV